MILPIVAYGDPVLKRPGVEIKETYPGLEQLIGDMFETMYMAHGVGLAAPQVGLSIRLFVVDASPYSEDHEELKDFKRVLINARKVEIEGEEWLFSEGCLSIPDIREDIGRMQRITLSYLDKEFSPQVETFGGIAGRIIMHEYDHIEGKLFTDYLSPLKKRMLQARLEAITKGEVKTEYKMRFPLRKKRPKKM